MTSSEKVKAALDQCEALADDPDASPAVKTAAAMLMMGRGHVERLIPTDPTELDVLLEQGADWLRGLMSDPSALETAARQDASA